MVFAAISPVASLRISCSKRRTLSLTSRIADVTVTTSPAKSSRLYSMCCSTPAIPRFSACRRERVRPSIAKSCHVASSNLAT
jgi:hypothetical protein